MPLRLVVAGAVVDVWRCGVGPWAVAAGPSPLGRPHLSEGSQESGRQSGCLGPDAKQTAAVGPVKGFVMTLKPGDWLIVGPTDFPTGAPSRVLYKARSYDEACEHAPRHALDHLVILQVAEARHWKR